MCFQTDILPYLQNYELCIQHLKNLGLLPRSLNCPICKNRLFWTRYKKVKDGFGWKCQNGNCAKFKSIFSNRTGSFFARSNIQLVTFNLPTNLQLFVSISTCFNHSINNILVKKPFSFFGGGEFLTRCTWGGGNRSHGPLVSVTDCYECVCFKINTLFSMWRCLQS